MFSSSISKGRFTVLCAAAILFFSCSVPFSAQGDQIRILVAPEFKNISGVKEIEQLAIPDLLTTAFKKYGEDRIEIIERESIPEILDVIAFEEEMRGIVDSKTVTELRGLGANFYATGKITKLNKQIIVIVRLINMIELTIRTSKIITFEEEDKNIPEKIDCLGSQLIYEILPPLSPLIWEIGKDDNSFGEFNQLPKFPGPFPWHYNGGNPPDEFPKEINDGERTPIYIHYSLTEEQADKDLALILDACGGAGDDFSIRVITLANGEKPQSLGVYKFSTSKSILDKEKRHEIKIDNAKTKSGTNTLILENASPPNSGRWLFWDYLSLIIDEKAKPVPIRCVGFYPFGNIKIQPSPDGSYFVANGLSSSYRGYTKAGYFEIGERRTLTVRIEGSNKSEFFNMNKMLKIIVGVEDFGLHCEDGNVRADDPEFIYKADGTFSYKIPEKVVSNGVLRKVGFVFGPGEIKDLKVTAWFE
ncbi:MAG: hypothetical protein AB1422_00610 [bacterium]